jgi:hypothetical protein
MVILIVDKHRNKSYLIWIARKILIAVAWQMLHIFFILQVKVLTTFQFIILDEYKMELLFCDPIH